MTSPYWCPPSRLCLYVLTMVLIMGSVHICSMRVTIITTINQCMYKDGRNSVAGQLLRESTKFDFFVKRVRAVLVWQTSKPGILEWSVTDQLCEGGGGGGGVPLHWRHKQRVLMHGHQGWNVRHGLCHIYMIYVYKWVVYSFCLFCCLFIIVTTQFVALYKPCKPKPKPSTYDPPDNHPLAEIQRPILRPEPKQQICHQHANTDHFGK